MGMTAFRRLSHLLGLLTLVACCSVAAADPNKILRVTTFDIETLDPQQYNDDPSFRVITAIFEGLYEWDYLAATPSLTPVTAAGPPEISADGKTWTIRLKPGIYFTDDPAFHGKPRELVAQDFVYSITRWLDPNLRRGGAPVPTDLIVGARAVVDAARETGKLDYDRPIDGLRALDRHTLQLKLTQVNYPIAQAILNYLVCAREVVDTARGDIRARPIGTGPYRLREWKRGSRIVLEANPKYRSLRFPASGDPAHAALVKSMQGKTLPQIGVVELNVIEEDVTQLLEFERGVLDYVELRAQIASRLLANGKLKPEYAARGIARHVFAEPFLFAIYFNIADPVVGGMGNERVARRVPSHAVPGLRQGAGRWQISGLLGRLRRRSLRLPGARPARQPPAADREYGALSPGGIRSGGRSFLREPERGRSQRRRAPGIRARVDLRADPADDLPARERFRPAVGAGIQQTDLHQLLEVSRQ